MINNNHYTINNNINNDSNNNNNDTYTKNKCGTNKVCKIKSNGYNVHDTRLILSITKLLVLIMVNVVIIGIFVNITFKLSSYAPASFGLALFESVLLSNICLWLIFSFISRHCILIP